MPPDQPTAPAAETLPPLSERWPQIVAYPLHPAALSTVVAIAVAHLVTLLPLGFILDLLVWAAFFKYGFEVLRWSANGREEAPEISLTVSDGIARYAMLLLVLSELLIILALEEGMSRALNPIAWLMLGQRIGREYFVLVGFFVAALFVQSVVGHLLSAALPELFALPPTYFVVNYLMIANFHLIGGVIHAHADELGYMGHLELKEEVPHTDPARKILDSARARAATGDTQGAATLLREEIAAHPESLMLHDELRHWLRQSGEKSELVKHAKTYIPLLLAKDQDRRAMEIVRECQAIDPAFALDKAEDVTRLAHVAAEAGQTQLAVGLLAGFHKRFRNHPDIGRNYLLAAKLWAERMNKEKQARAMLQQIKLTMPNDPVIPQVDAYLAFLDKLAATAPKRVGLPVK